MKETMGEKSLYLYLLFTLICGRNVDENNYVYNELPIS